jgi:hypothetical protein
VIDGEVRELIRKMSLANPLWGAPRIHGELLKLGIEVSQAISNHRLLAFDGETVTFRSKDDAHGNQQCTMDLPVPEFLRRFLQHVLPRGFVRIRQFGYLATPSPNSPARLGP